MRAVGFGRNTTGGKGADTCWVTNLKDSGKGSLRDCAQRRLPNWIRFKVSGEIRMKSPLFVNSNTTIDGRGSKVIISGYGLRLHGVNNIIIHNIELRGGEGEIGDNELNNDAIQIWRGSSNIWIDHVSASGWPDELLDISHGSTDITVSWSRFFRESGGRNFGIIIGSSPSHVGDENIRVTMHHNYFKKLDQRMPRVRFAKLHLFNNYFFDWEDYATWASQRSQVLSEGNIYEAVRSMDAMKALPAGSDPDPGEIGDVGSWMLGGARMQERNPHKIFDPGKYYPYIVQKADTSLRDMIISGTGVR